MNHETKQPLPPRRSNQAVGRGPKVRAAVLATTLEVLAESGYTALTVEHVAHRAGVHKTTIYRRWKDRDRLIIDALTEQVAIDIPIPDSGSFETDLVELSWSLVRLLSSPVGRGIIAVLLSDAARIPEIDEIRRNVFADRFRRAEPVVQRAIDRGELPVDTDAVEVIKALVAPIYFRLLIAGEAVDKPEAERAALAALAAARAGIFGATGER